MFDLSHHVAIVTGAGRGIGRVVALQLAAGGAAVAVNYRTSAVPAEEVAEQIRAKGGRAVALQADVTDEAQVSRLVEATLAEFGHVDILVNNAGYSRPRSTEETPLEEWEQVLRTNLTSAFLCTRAVLPSMRARGWGRIVNMSSIAGRTGGIVAPHYAAAKGALLSLTRFWGRELAKAGICVNCVAPNTVDTDMLRSFASPELVGRMIAASPMGRLCRPEEVAAAVIYLCSEEASFVTGECLGVTGGL